MNRSRSNPKNPTVPSAVLAAAVLLSLSSAADVTVAAVLMNAGRQLPTRVATEGESLGQWLTRFTDAARQMRDVFTGDDASVIGQAHAAVPSGIDAVLAVAGVSAAPQDDDRLPHAAPLTAHLTDLPPPLR